MFHGVAGEIVFEEMSASTYETKFWDAIGGYDENLDADLIIINSPVGTIETARQNGHSPERLAEIIKSNMN